MFEKYGVFRTDLGPTPDSEIRNEDTEFSHRLLNAGERLRYEPSAVVYHAVPESRIQKKFLRRWNFDKARGDVRAFGIPSDASWFVYGIPLNMVRRLARWALQYMVTVNPQRRFDCTLKMYRGAGYIAECRSLWRDARRKKRSNPEVLSNKL